MTGRSWHLSQELQDYLIAHASPPDEVLTGLAAETARRFPGPSGMQIGPDQGALMTLLTRLTGVRSAVEVGTFTGYSAICIARGLAEGGKLTCCDVSEDWTALAREYWQRAGLADRIELRLGPALDTLRALPAGPHLDLAFIDADKSGYVGYWDEIVPRIRPGGIILVDNTLQGGEVADPAVTDAQVTGMRAFNDHTAADPRVDLVLLPVGDGLTLARRR
ncbi:MAG: O-methyltransferase [Streptosporangiaceae bacterium]